MERKFLTKMINEAEAVTSWSQVITEATGVKDVERLEWMSVLLENKNRIEQILSANRKNINEDGYGSSTPAFLGGEGGVTFPTDPSSAVGGKTGAFYDPTYQTGSGDTPSPKLAVAMNVAAYTNGFDMLPIIPMESPSMIFTYLDEVYGGGTIDGVNQSPLYVEISGGTIGGAFDLTGFTKGAWVVLAGTAVDNTLVDGITVRGRYMGTTWNTGKPIIKVEDFKTMTAATGALVAITDKSIKDVIDAHVRHALIPCNVAGDTATVASVVNLTDKAAASRVSATVNNIVEANNSDGISEDPMSRADGEKGTENTITLERFSTAVEAKAYKINAQTTQEDEYDLALMGVNASAQLYKAAQNSITQAINRHIIRTMFRLGVQNHAQLNAAHGINQNLFIAPATTANKAFNTFGLTEFKDMLGVDRSAEFGNIINAETNSAAENRQTRQRNVVSRILAVRNIMSTYGRHGIGDQVIVNQQVGTMLQDIANYPAAQFDNTIKRDTKNMYYIGDVHGMRVYVDPKMQYEDTRICVSRKGEIEEPGLKLFPLDLASSIELVSEQTGSRKIMISSRYALVPCGFYPETQYFTFGVNTGFGNWV